MRVDQGAGLAYVQRDHRAREEQIGDIGTLSEAQRVACRRVVCGFASRNNLDAEAAAELMSALGIHPTQPDDPYLTGPPEAVNANNGRVLKVDA